MAKLIDDNSTRDMQLPDWASAWGQDEYGVFVEFSLSTGGQYWDFFDQRLRWIPPGRFLMGSPETKDGRFPRECPQHEVTISQGFWMMDTPVTQRLWELVMGDNPSRFVDPDRPVERVEWDRCAEFCRHLSERVGAKFELSTEAQWEYACRAGSQAATYAGDINILGERNAPGLDVIAWYGGNSGVDFDLENGWDSSDWPEKQFDHATAGTRKVAQKQPNTWGLYDVLGNVWEWCRDGLRTYSDQPVTDALGSNEEGAGRVIRGGSWYDRAQYVRAAFRDADVPGDRGSDLGFRCVCSVTE